MPTLAADNFYRYQVQLQSDANALYTPSIDSVYVGWNLQPRKPILSRITIGTKQPHHTLAQRYSVFFDRSPRQLVCRA
jgi:hypothetical protein